MAFVSGGFIHSPRGQEVTLKFPGTIRCHQYTTWYDSKTVCLTTIRIAERGAR
jgi:hypothetical protein